MSLKERARRPVSSAETTGTRVPRSPWRTRSVASRSASSGPKIERDSRIVSSSEIVNASTTATTTAGPRSDSCAPWRLSSIPATIAPVSTLIAGSPTSSRRRSGTPPRPGSKSSDRCSATSASTGRSSDSIAKKRNSAPYSSVSNIPAKIASEAHAGSPSSTVANAPNGTITSRIGIVRTRRAYVLGMNASARQASVVLTRSRAPFSHASTGESSRRASTIELMLSSATSSSATTSSTTKLRLLIGW